MSENQGLKNEIARLNSLIANSELEYARLKAEVKRLTKAGDAVIHEWSNGDEKDAKNFLKALAIWLASKGGKQS